MRLGRQAFRAAKARLSPCTNTIKKTVNATLPLVSGDRLQAVDIPLSGV
jgi:hypothetical protein